MPPDERDLLTAAARVAAALHETGSVMVYRTSDGRMAATAGGRTGYGPDRDAALGDLARQFDAHGPADDL
jgi:hypothetical protein